MGCGGSKPQDPWLLAAKGARPAATARCPLSQLCCWRPLVPGPLALQACPLPADTAHPAVTPAGSTGALSHWLDSGGAVDAVDTQHGRGALLHAAARADQVDALKVGAARPRPAGCGGGAGSCPLHLSACDALGSAAAARPHAAAPACLGLARRSCCSSAAPMSTLRPRSKARHCTLPPPAAPAML